MLEDSAAILSSSRLSGLNDNVFTGTNYTDNHIEGSSIERYSQVA